MNIIDELKRYMCRGEIDVSKLLILLPKCVGYDTEKHDKIVLRFLRCCDNYWCDFAVSGNQVEFTSRSSGKYKMIITIEECISRPVGKMSIKLEEQGEPPFDID